MRQLAKQLNYKQAVVLSHMANGRAPIPIDRAEDIARMLEINATKFLRAVIEQRHPEVNWHLIAKPSGTAGEEELGSELEIILDAPLSDLNAEQRSVMREVVAEKRPSRRWLTVHELPAVERWREQTRQTPCEVDEILAMLESEEHRGKDQSGSLKS